MFRTLMYPSSGACDNSVELPHWSYCSWFDVCWVGVVSVLQAASACNTDTTPTQPHWTSNTHRTKYNMTNVVIQQNCCKLLMMDILMSETCWAHKKWNKIASDIKLLFYSSTIIEIISGKTHSWWLQCISHFVGLHCLTLTQISKRESNPITGLDRPWGFQEDEAPWFQDSQHMKVVRLSALFTGHLYPPGNIPGTHFC